MSKVCLFINYEGFKHAWSGQPSYPCVSVKTNTAPGTFVAVSQQIFDSGSVIPKCEGHGHLQQIGTETEE